MSISRISTTSGTMAAASAIAQAQAVQYATRFVELQKAIDSGDLDGARQALLDFRREAAVVSVHGLDPVSQTVSLRKEFASIRRALQQGDIRSAQASLTNLKKELGVESPEIPEDASLETTSDVIPSGGGRGVASAAVPVGAESGKSGFISSAKPKGAGRGEDLESALLSREWDAEEEVTQTTSSTFIRTQPAMTSFSQSPQVFPTSTASEARIAIPSVSTSTQAVLQGLAATQPDAQVLDEDGTPFAPTPELLLWTKGMSIPDGAQLRFADHPTLLQTISDRLI